MFDEDDDLDSHQNLPIFKKGEEILQLTEKVVSLITDEDDEVLNEYKRWMIQDATTLCVRVAGAEAGELYDIKMESAALIRKAARELRVNCTGLRMMGYKQPDYLKLIQSEIEEYRHLFIEWVSTFDPWNFEVDNWGLFNPPGVDPNAPNP
ncbi:hypothetical protein [Marinoscillum furvescens]|uniref:Uncharacterized protein n=1 Tax=Marinoscillum furvescens DSM 4134 TaxID=1122208 RepID=A0A3D9LGT9_MARFU|nr:hypothetical protein [Marinoscillum furvescens]REE05920.1 hypothetical protein C7460_101439 [Marinoscillum furvescens DSM 4134]